MAGDRSTTAATAKDGARDAATDFRIRGKSVPMLTVTAIPGWRGWLTRVVYWIARRGTFRHLRAMRSIHFARWLIVGRRRFPRLAATQPKESLRDDYLVFSTNFNGRWDEYIDEFVLPPTLRRGVKWLWRASRAFPGPWPLGRFKRYIRSHQYPTRYYYNAYPEASVTDILKALELASELNDFDARTRHLDPISFKRHYDAFSLKVANHLCTTADLEDQPSPHEYFQPIHH